ncbi:MAG: ThiF family adenylyltransferase [Euryarchaeota archaeon]|nr:ThiF family adenylyltransferase [Euryarchaeota archaeon]
MPTADPAFFAGHQEILPLDAIRARHFTIAGCGSLGSLIGRILARLGAHRFHLVDAEKVELRHLSRSVYAFEHVGTNKAAALSFQLGKIHSKVRCVTTSKALTEDHLKRGKEDILIFTTSDPTLPKRALEWFRDWPANERPSMWVTRYSELQGGYWYADLKNDMPDAVPELPWLHPTGHDQPDAARRIVTTAHVVAGLVCHSIVDHFMARPFKARVDVDLEALLRG